MNSAPKTVLVLCTGNSARSIIAECLFNRLGQGRFIAYSAGSQPAGAVNPFAIELLDHEGFDTEGLRSKSWDEFAGTDAPRIDYVITVCDNAAGETCPLWPGNPTTAHWGIPDPAACDGTDEQRSAAFAAAMKQLTARIKEFLELPIDQLDGDALARELERIGKLD